MGIITRLCFLRMQQDNTFRALGMQLSRLSIQERAVSITSASPESWIPGSLVFRKGELANQNSESAGHGEPGQTLPGRPEDEFPPPGPRTIFSTHFQEGHVEEFPELFQTPFSQMF